MAKRIVNKAERNAERYDAKETGYRLFEDSQNGKTFDRLMPLIVSEQNIILAYRNICKNSGSKTPGTDGKTIVAIQSLPIESVIKTVRNKLNYYQPKKVRRVEIPKDNGKTRPLGIPSIWDRLIQQCILQILEPICEAKFHERNNGFRPYRSTQNAIAQCYKMAQLQNLHFVVDVDIVGFFDNIDHSKLIRQLWGIGIQDRKLIMIIKQMLKAEILFNDIIITPETGTPQGGFYAPLRAMLNFAGKLMIQDSEYPPDQTAHYSPGNYIGHSRGVYYNAASDMTNPRGAGTTYFHELAHMIDHASCNYRSNLSNTPEFAEALVEDGQRILSLYNNLPVEKQTAFLTRIRQDSAHSFSDLIDATTNGQLHGNYGHSRNYWTRPGNLQAEAFAHFFEASMGDQGKLELLANFFPTAFGIFSSMIDSIRPDNHVRVLSRER